MKKYYKVIWAVKQNNYVITENNIKNNDSIKRADQATEIVRYKNFVTKKSDRGKGKKWWQAYQKKRPY